jgi:hypothetical protein
MGRLKGLEEHAFHSARTIPRLKQYPTIREPSHAKVHVAAPRGNDPALTLVDDAAVERAVHEKDERTVYEPAQEPAASALDPRPGAMRRTTGRGATTRRTHDQDELAREYNYAHPRKEHE